MVENKKYLIFDNIVRGAGLGHTMTSYNYGLDYSLKNNLEWVPAKIITGHSLSKGGKRSLEEELGLPVVSREKRSGILNNREKYEHIQYSGKHKISNDLSLTGLIYKKWYKKSREERKNKYIDDSKINICMSIRRGDLAISPSHRMRHRLYSVSDYIKLLKNILKENDIADYRLIVSTDVRGEYVGLVDEYNNPLNEKRVFEDHLKDFIFLPLNESHSNEKEFVNTTYDFFHSAISSEYFIGSHSGFSEVIKHFYRTGNTYMVNKDCR